MKKNPFFLIPLLLLLNTGCDDRETKTIEVTASAYNSVAYQTSSEPSLTAWGDTLKPGMKALAISRDLIDSGLTHMSKVKIDGLPGKYIVRDKMNRRWKKKIDIYFGHNVDSARAWGKKKVTISFRAPEKEEEPV